MTFTNSSKDLGMLTETSSMSDSYLTSLQPPVGLKFDNDKLLYSLIPPETTKALAEVLTFGAKKYAIDGWKYVPDAKRRYMDALFRHLEAFRSGELYDQESGLSHLSHVLANASFLHYFYSKD